MTNETTTSLRDIYDAEFPFVCRTLLQLGVPEADIPDAVQEVFLVVNRRLAEFQYRAKLRTWLYRICAFVARGRRRLAHVRREIPHDDLDQDERLATEPNASSDLAVLNSLLNQLGSEQREVFVLFELEGWSGPEVAESLQCPLPTVYSRLRLARGAFFAAVDRLKAREEHLMRKVQA
ncbi:MAG TPA: sigma-70 family RNA polymerase sigma factor [Polyangiaceae bacterium]